MDPIKTIGQKLTGDEKRDAIHIAVLPVICEADYLNPGSAVEFVHGSTDRVCDLRRGPAIGVVDPFLEGCVNRGDKVWIFMKPGTVTGMRHQWSHPSIPEEEDNEALIAKRVVQKLRGPAFESENWLRRFAQQHDIDYDEMIAIATAGSNERYITAGSDLYLDPSDKAEFWDHVETFMGKRFSEDQKTTLGWSCAC